MNSSKPNFCNIRNNIDNKPIDDKYIIQKNLKAGGFGYVYIASDIKQKNKCYAIKLMPMTAKKYADI